MNCKRIIFRFNIEFNFKNIEIPITLHWYYFVVLNLLIDMIGLQYSHLLALGTLKHRMLYSHSSHNMTIYDLIDLITKYHAYKF